MMRFRFTIRDLLWLTALNLRWGLVGQLTIFKCWICLSRREYFTPRNCPTEQANCKNRCQIPRLGVRAILIPRAANGNRQFVSNA